MPFIDSFCGKICDECEERNNKQCGGCMASNGSPSLEACEIAECAKAKGKRFCGECEHIPCEIITRYAYDKERGDNGARIIRCKEQKARLVYEARMGVNSVSFCGHHCDFCFYAEWCGGCRSSYNCCSFATLFDGNTCPNVTCAKEKNLKGCYKCADLYDCDKGYYGRENEYIAKATALFIKKHGEDCYTITLKRAIEAGEHYPKTFDASGSVASALAILEGYFQP